jgi:hypothetical protein
MNAATAFEFVELYRRRRVAVLQAVDQERIDIANQLLAEYLGQAFVDWLRARNIHPTRPIYFGEMRLELFYSRRAKPPGVTVSTSWLADVDFQTFAVLDSGDEEEQIPPETYPNAQDRVRAQFPGRRFCWALVYNESCNGKSFLVLRMPPYESLFE